MMKGQARTSLSLGWNIYHREYPVLAVQQLIYWKEPLIVIALLITINDAQFLAPKRTVLSGSHL